MASSEASMVPEDKHTPQVKASGLSSDMETSTTDQSDDQDTQAETHDQEAGGAESIYAPSTTASSISVPILEVDTDEGFSDADSAITNVGGGSTQSVRSSLYDYVEENGRMYHRYKEGKYIMPNDTKEQERLDLQHQICLILLDGRLHLAPIKKDLQSALDIGTGTGLWAIEFASKYPSATVIGTDLSPIQPEYVPPNLQFEVDDAEDDWIYSHSFDYIHMRAMMTCFKDPRSIIEKAFNFTNPGGWVELQDAVFPIRCHDDTLEGTALDKWSKACVEGAAKLGRVWTNVPNYRPWMIEMGFEDVHEKIFEIPLNPWPRGKKQKELGMWFQADFLDAVSASMAVLTRGLGWKAEEVEVMLVDVRNDIKNKAVHGYMPVHSVWGRKPRS